MDITNCKEDDVDIGKNSQHKVSLSLRFACSLQQLQRVYLHSHRERNLADLPPNSFTPAIDSVNNSGGLPRVDATSVSSCEFSSRFVREGQPALITGLCEGWRAQERWSSCTAMLQHYGDVLFKVRPLNLELPLRLYVEHVKRMRADFPFYVVEHNLNGQRAPLLQDFEVPPYFQDDLFELTEYTRCFFPYYRCITIGIERTGTNLHVNYVPPCSSSWTTLLCGLKRWALFPPGNSDAYLSRIGASSSTNEYDATPANWWLDTLPRLQSMGADRELGLVECVQHPGETIYVPHGWWHCVLNLDFTVAVSQNLLAPDEFSRVWNQLEVDFPGFAPEFARIVNEQRPDVKLHGAAMAAALRAQRSLFTMGSIHNTPTSQSTSHESKRSMAENSRKSLRKQVEAALSITGCPCCCENRRDNPFVDVCCDLPSTNLEVVKSQMRKQVEEACKHIASLQDAKLDLSQHVDAESTNGKCIRSHTFAPTLDNSQACG